LEETKVSLLRFLGLGGESEKRSEAADSASVRRIAARLEQLGPDKSKYVAAFAYVLARIANADLEIADTETAEMERSMRALSGLSESEAALAVEIAKSQARTLGGTENYMVTREFRAISSREQRGGLLQCLYAVAAADGTIDTTESAEIVSIGEELGFTRLEANSLRTQYRDKLAEFQIGK
jgi:uncharacterized tellurite resistance protein B-like protein